MTILASTSVKINLRRLSQFKAQATADLNNQANGPIRKALKQWAVRYRSFAQERFDAYSKGGGDWAPLSPATIARRRKANTSKKKAAVPKKEKKLGSISSFFQFVLGKKPKKKTSSGSDDKKPKKKKKPSKSKKLKKLKKERKIAILRDLGMLFMVLAPNFTSQPGSVEVHKPFGVTVGYGGPHKHGDGSITIADIASFHQSGGDRLPQRKIIVQPASSVTAAMTEDMKRAMLKMK